jgi:hypothetical protein
MSSLDDKVKYIRELAATYGMTIQVHKKVITISAKFEPNDEAAFMKLENKAYEILRSFRQVRAGTTWGTEGIARPIAIKEGRFNLSKSGAESRLIDRFR